MRPDIGQGPNDYGRVNTDEQKRRVQRLVASRMSAADTRIVLEHLGLLYRIPAPLVGAVET